MGCFHRFIEYVRRRLMRPPSIDMRATWNFPFVATAVDIVCQALIFALLQYYDGRVPPTWKFGLSISSILSIFATVSEFSRASALTSGVICLCFTLYKKKARPLANVQIVDDAIRHRPRGLSKLIILCIQRGYWLLLLGAVLLSSTPLTSVMTQLEHVMRLLTTSSGTALLNVAMISNLTSPGRSSLVSDLNTNLVKATLGGLINSSGSFGQPDFHCPTSHCRFEHYYSMAMVKECADLSQEILADCTDYKKSNTCSFTLPWGNLTLSSPQESMTTQPFLPAPNDPLFKQKPQQFIQVRTLRRSNASSTTAEAHVCLLYFALQEKSAEIKDGVLNETIISTHFNSTSNYTDPKNLPPASSFFSIAISPASDGKFVATTSSMTIAWQDSALDLLRGDKHVNPRTGAIDYTTDAARLFDVPLADGSFDAMFERIASLNSLEFRNHDLHHSQAEGVALHERQVLRFLWQWWVPQMVAALLTLVLVWNVRWVAMAEGLENNGRIGNIALYFLSVALDDKDRNTAAAESRGMLPEHQVWDTHVQLLEEGRLGLHTQDHGEGEGDVEG